VVDVADHVRDPDDLAFEGRRHILFLPVEDLTPALGVAGDAVSNFEGQVQALALVFELLDHPEALEIVVESAGEELGQGLLARVAERRVADVVAQGDRLGQVLVQAERLGDRPADGRDFEGVGQARAVMVAVGGQEDLGLVFEASEALGVEDAIPVALEGRAEGVRSFLALAAARIAAKTGLGRQGLGLGLFQLFPDIRHGFPLGTI
jgi:hypothetical protein